MKIKPLAIKGIAQIDNYSFQIEWLDGHISLYRLFDLQKLCPCAGCIDESTGARRRDASYVDEKVRAISIRSVGRYAIKIDFSSGCSAGIFSYDLLRSLA